MKLNIIRETENPLFKRKEIEATVENEVTPMNTEVRKLISEKLSIPEETIKLKGVRGSFGSREFRIYANIYESTEAKNSVELKKKWEKEEEKKALDAEEAKKKAEEDAKAAEEAAKAEAEKPKEETPAEEPAQETKEPVKEEKKE